MIEITNVTLAYGRLLGPPKVVAQDITLHLTAGEIHALLGPNRAGKTTLVRAMIGLLAPVRGGVRVHGLDPVEHRREVVARTGALLDGGRVLPPRWTGLEVLVFAGVLHGSDVSRAERRGKELLEQFGLADVGHHLVNKYSRGMRQRLLLAATLVHDPELLILDEPTLGLDAESAREFRRCLLSLRRRGRTILLTTHEMTLVESLADRVTVLNQGRVVASGPVAAVVEAIGAQRRLHISFAEAPAALAALPGVEVEGHTVHVPLDLALLSRLFAVLAEAGASVSNITADSGLDAALAQLGGQAP